MDEILCSTNILLIDKTHYRDIIDNSYQYVRKTFMSLFNKKIFDFPYMFGDRIFTLQDFDLLKGKLIMYIPNKVEEVKYAKAKWVKIDVKLIPKLIKQDFLA